MVSASDKKNTRVFLCLWRSSTLPTSQWHCTAYRQPAAKAWQGLAAVGTAGMLLSDRLQSVRGTLDGLGASTFFTMYVAAAEVLRCALGISCGSGFAHVFVASVTPGRRWMGGWRNFPAQPIPHTLNPEGFYPNLWLIFFYSKVTTQNNPKLGTLVPPGGAPWLGWWVAGWKGIGMKPISQNFQPFSGDLEVAKKASKNSNKQQMDN